MGLTDNENPYGDLPPIFARSMGNAAASMMADYVGQYLETRRGKRSTKEAIPPETEKVILDRFHGGERYLKVDNYFFLLIPHKIGIKTQKKDIRFKIY